MHYLGGIGRHHISNAWTQPTADTLAAAHIRRASLYAGIFAVHLILLSWIASGYGVVEKQATPKQFGSLKIFQLPPAPLPSRPPVAHLNAPILQPAKLLQISYHPLEFSPAPVSLPSEVATGSECDLTGQVQSALRASDPVKAALIALPRSARSVANAVMIWDGHWVNADKPGSPAAFEQIKRTVVDTVTQASSECQMQAETGPRLILLNDAANTVIVLGSGNWRWGDLAAAPSADANDRSASSENPVSVQASASAGAPIPYLRKPTAFHNYAPPG